MKSLPTSPRYLAIPLLGLLCGLPALSAAAVSPVSPGPSLLATTTAVRPLQDDKHLAFRKAFEDAMKVGALSEMERLVKKNMPLAVEWIVVTAEAISNRTGDELETRMAALRKAWKGAAGTQFANNMYEYFSLLEPVFKAERIKLKAGYEKANLRYHQNSEKKDGGVYGLLYNELDTIGKTLTQLGDHYGASQCWMVAFNCYTEANRGEDVDLYKCYEAAKNAVESRLKVDLKDSYYTQMNSTYEYLKSQGYGGEGEGEGGVGGPPKGGIVKEGAAITAEMSFEIVPKLENFKRPSFYADELHNLWARLSLLKKGSKTKFSSLGDASPAVMRTGSSECLVDTDGDGAGDMKIPLRGKLEPIEFTITKDGESRTWGCLTKIGTQSDMYQRIQVSMAPTDDQMMIYLAPGASVIGELAGVPIRVLDDNMDGIFGSIPVSWRHDGLTKDMLHPDMDAIVIGDAKQAQPWSEFQKIGETWYRLEPDAGGQRLNAYSVEMETGKVKVSAKGGKPTWLVVKGKGKYENCYFDLMAKNVELPVGEYSLFCGELRKGKKQQTMKCLILPGENTPTIDVNAGGTTEFKLGAPYGFAFEFEEDEKTISIPGNTIAVTGSAGERYERLWNCVPRPAVSWRKKGAKKGSKAEKMDNVKTQEEINRGGWALAWFPKDLLIAKKGLVEDSEVQLIDKKSKMFGKIESDWKD